MQRYHWLDSLSLQVTLRDDADEHNLRTSAYEAVNSWIMHSAKDTLPIVGKLVPILIDRLEKTFSMQVRRSCVPCSPLICAILLRRS